MPQRFELANEDAMSYADEWPVRFGREVEIDSGDLSPEELLELLEELETRWGLEWRAEQ